MAREFDFYYPPLYSKMRVLRLLVLVNIEPSLTVEYEVGEPPRAPPRAGPEVCRCIYRQEGGHVHSASPNAPTKGRRKLTFTMATP